MKNTTTSLKVSIKDNQINSKPFFFRCKKCCLPSSKPDLHFDDEGVCMACRYREHEKTIHWEARKQEFLELVKPYRGANPNNYDCIIAVSGGKDSCYQVHLIKEIGKLNPLLVSFEPSCPTEIGQHNLQVMVDGYGCDLIQLKKSSRTYRKLARLGFDVVGDHEWPNHVGIFCWPMQMAVKFNIPLTFYGESRGTIGLGRWETLINQKEITRSDVEQYIGMNGFRLTDMLEIDTSLKLEECLPYIYPDAKSKKKLDIHAYNLGYYFYWDYMKNIPVIRKKGWRRLDHSKDGTFANWEDLDCGFMPYHQYLKFIKYGYARATDHAASEIRLGRMFREQAKELIMEYDWKLPTEYFQEFLDFLDIDEEYFFKTVDKFANPILFETDNEGNFIRMHDGNLILKNWWYESFDI